jgi:hypothetical protein
VRKIVATLVIYLCSFQLCFAETLMTVKSRVPASFGHEIELAALIARLDKFKTSISGKDLVSDCDKKKEAAEVEALIDNNASEAATPAAPKDDFDLLLADLKQNACGHYVYSWDQKKPVEEADECAPKREKGLIEKLVVETMQLEKDEKEPKEFRLDDPVVRKLHQEAIFLQQEVRKYLSDTTVDREERQNLLVTYLDSAALPMRDLIVAKRAYMPLEYNGVYFYESLLLDFPTSLFPANDQDARDLITLGPNPSTSPFQLMITDQRFGRSTLRYRPVDIMQRDILTLLRAPTAQNYITALKWMTLHMMLSQVYVYDSMMGNANGEVSVPRSCQNQFNGDLPEKLKFDIRPGQGDEFMDNLLASQAMIFSFNNYQFMEYYRDNASKDPTKDGYSGLTPFEDYHYAQAGLSEEKRKYLAPDIDDHSHFDTVIGLKAGDLNEVYKGQSFGWFGLAEKKDYTYLGSQLMDQILAVPGQDDVYEITDKEGKKVEINAERQNLSVYLANTMKRYGVTHYEDIITGELKTRLQNTPVTIDMPSLNGASLWRQWAINNLYEALTGLLTDGKAKRSSEMQAVQSLCNAGRGGNPAPGICVANNSEATIINLVAKLSPVAATGEYVPLRRLEEAKISAIYPFLARVWNVLRDRTTVLPEAKTNEYQFIVDQMAAINPWARLRLSYLVATEELRVYRQGHQMNLRMSNQRNAAYNQSFCFYKNVNSISEKLAEAGKVLGLDQTLSPSHANKVLSKDEKEYLWKDTYDTANDKTSRLFVTQNRSGQEYYKVLEDISYKTLLTSNQVDTFLSEKRMTPSAKARTELTEVFNSPEAKVGEFYLNLYKMRGDVKKQKEYFEEHSKEHGLQQEYDAKLGFLSLDNDIKRTIYRDVLRSAASKRKAEVLDRLEDFCGMHANDHENFKALFHATSKAQNQINQMAGLPGVPETVLDKVNSMTADEWTDMWLGLGAGLLGVAAILIGGACTGLTGGLCAPLGIAMIAAGVSAMGMQVALVSREFDRKLESNRFEEQVSSMEKLGFALPDSSSEVSRSWFWTIFEVICIIPLIGVVSRSAKVGTKLTVVTTASLARNVGKVGVKGAWRLAGQAGKTVVAEADVAFARYVLGFDSIGKQFGEMIKGASDGSRYVGGLLTRLLEMGASPKVVKEAGEKMRGIRILFGQGKISAETMANRIAKVIEAVKKSFVRGGSPVYEYASNVVVKETPQAIDQATARTVSTYFGHNPNGMLRLVKSYSKRLAKASGTMEKIEKGETLVGRIPVLGTMVNWARKLRVEELAKNADKIKGIEAGLTEVAKNGGDLEKFVFENIRDLTDMFVKIPMRKRELPYMMLLQGGPHVGGPLAGRRMPMLSDMADGLILRKFFNARSRLVFESHKAAAREILGLAPNVASEGAFAAVKSFQESMRSAIELAPEAEARTLGAQLSDYQEVLAKQIHEKARHELSRGDKLARINRALFNERYGAYTKIENLDLATIKRLLFSPQGPADEAVAQVLFDSANVDQLFDLAEASTIAHRAIETLANYKDVDGFQRFVNALKVLVLHRDPGVVEIM